jgi:hypothetical protein
VAAASYPTSHRVVILGAPLTLGLLEVWHPALLPGENIAQTLMPIATWWTTLHVLQIPLFALLGVALFLILRDLQGRAVRIGRAAIAVFVVIYPAFDAAVGVGSGVMVYTLASARGSASDIEQGLQALFWGPVTGTLALIGSACWLFANATAAWAWRRAGAPLYVTIAFGLSGIFLAIAHVRPLGPLACLSLLVGASWVVFRAPASGSSGV